MKTNILSDFCSVSGKTHQLHQQPFKYITNIFWLLKGKTNGMSLIIYLVVIRKCYSFNQKVLIPDFLETINTRV